MDLTNNDLLMTVAIARLSQSGWSSLEKDLKNLVSEIILGHLPREFILQSTINICSHLAKGKQPNFEFQNHGDSEMTKLTLTLPNSKDGGDLGHQNGLVDNLSSGVSEASKNLISSPVADEQNLVENMDKEIKMETNADMNNQTHSLLKEMEEASQQNNNQTASQQLLANLAEFQQKNNKTSDQQQIHDQIYQIQKIQNSLQIQNSINHNSLQNNNNNSSSTPQATIPDSITEMSTKFEVESNDNNEANTEALKSADNVKSVIESLLETLQNNSNETRNTDISALLNNNKTDANEDKPDGQHAVGGGGNNSSSSFSSLFTNTANNTSLPIMGDFSGLDLFMTGITNGAGGGPDISSTRRFKN